MGTPTATIRPKLQSLNPATGELFAEFDPASDADVKAAVARAQQAAPAWRALGVHDRARYLLRLKDVLYDRRNEIAALITREAGKPLVESLVAEVLVALDTLDYFARHAAAFLAPQDVPHHNLAVRLKRGRLEYEPYGVIGIISPSNYPLSIPIGEMAPALVAGNTVVLKPSEFTPQIGLAIGELLEAAELPPGVATVILGDGTTGRALVSAGIDKLIFTGSVPTGKRIQAAAAERLLPTVLELGGKDPMIVCADADLNLASSGAVWGAFTNAGQACLSVERCYVVRSVAEKFTRLCMEKAKQLRVGPGDDPSTDVGPLIRERQVRIVEEHVADAVAQGAVVLCGGRRPAAGGQGSGVGGQGTATIGEASPTPNSELRPALSLSPVPRPPSPGFFYEPTVLAGVHHGMRIMREETFGPVLPIMAVDDEAQAVALANDSEFGLSASVWTRDLARGERLARQIQAGAVMVNDCISYFGVCEAPHGGVKASGIGRSHSRLGLMEMVRVKYIDVDLVPKLPKLWWFRYDGMVRPMQGFVEFLFAGGVRRRVWGLASALAGLGKRRV
ncbi:MAG TPA: aldehyde dehydrogenase family protein [Terriglobia bacterium]|nr:aldehyde dehydrogenase family protein [Terriglobia bacterium]